LPELHKKSVGGNLLGIPSFFGFAGISTRLSLISFAPLFSFFLRYFFRFFSGFSS
jgi:hypothetical protein